MKKKVIKTNEMEQYLYPDNISTLDQFMQEIVAKSDGFVKLQYLNNDSETNPFFVSEDVKTVYVNFNNLTTIEEDEVMLMSDAEFEEQLAPFTFDICKGCAFDGNPDTGCDRILRKRDKINILEESCFLYTDPEELEVDEDQRVFYQPPDEDHGKIFQFPGKNKNKDGDDE
jgi:hypothetical protein